MVPLGELISPAGFKAGNDSDHPVYSVTKNSGFVPSTEYFKKQIFSRDLAGYKRVRPGDFAYATIHLDEGSIGIAPSEGLISPMYTVFRPNTTAVIPEYLLRFMKSPMALAQYPRFGKGSVHRRKSISFDALCQLMVPLPPPDEQRRIAAILGEADALRNKSRLARSRSDDLTQAIYLRMFGLSAAKFVTVNEIALPTKGSIRTGPFGSQLLHSEFVDEGVPVLGLDNVVENIFTWGERRYITQDKYTVLQRYTVKPGDVLISIMGTCGRCVVVPADIGTAINTKHICAITLNPDIALPEFVRATFLWHPRSRHHLAQRTKGSIMDGLNMGIVKDMPVPLPSLDQQQEFVTRARAVEVLHQSSCWLSQQTDELFASLQSRAFRGKL